MRTVVKTWGNSLAVRLPRVIAAEVGIAADSPLEIVVHEGSLILSPIEGRKKRLARLVSLMTAESLHPPDDFGDSVGRESL